jgi:MATE family multidrug resistance protein
MRFLVWLRGRVDMDVTSKEILRRALPLGLANMSVVLMPLLDSVMLGRHDVYSMASGGLAMQIYLILFMLGEGIVFGFGPIYGRYLDAGDVQKMASSKLAIYFLLLAFGVLALLGLLFGPEILLSLQQSPRLVDEARGYLICLGLSILPNLLFIHYWEILAFHDKGKIVVAGATIQLAVDIVLNYVLIYGKWGAPELGLLGAGIGTLIGALVGASVLFVFMSWHTSSPRVDIRELKKISTLVPYMLETLKLGVPIGFSIISTVAFLSASVFLMGWFSEEALAAHLAILQVNELIVVFILGFNEYCAIHVSSNASRLTGKSLRAFLYKVTMTAFIFIAVLLLAMFVLRLQIFALFLGAPTEETSPVYAHMEDFFSFALPFLLVDALILLLTGVLRGCEVTRWPLAINIIGFWLFGLLTQLMLVDAYPTTPLVIWIGMQVGFVVTAIGLAVFFMRFSSRSQFELYSATH